MFLVALEGRRWHLHANSEVLPHLLFICALQLTFPGLSFYTLAAAAVVHEEGQLTNREGDLYDIEASKQLFHRLKQHKHEQEQAAQFSFESSSPSAVLNHSPSKATQLVKKVLSDMLLKNNASVGHKSALAVLPNINAVFTTTTFVSSDQFGGTSMVSSTAFAPAASMLQSSSFSDLDAQNSYGQEVESEPMTSAIAAGGIIPIIVIGILFAFATTAGNLMVMISIRLDKQLQTISNYFLFSLAVADLTIGFISIPLMTYYTAVQYWGIGYAACQFWLSVDYLMSNASVLNLLLISFDRYFSVTRPLTYRPRRTTHKALIMIAGTFIISLVLWPPWIIGWPYIEGKFTVEEGTCVVQFLAVSGRSYPRIMATIGTAIAAFYLPVTIMIILYYRVFKETKRRQEELRKLQAGQFSPTQFGATSALHSLMLPLIRGMGGAAAYPISSSFTSANGNENGANNNTTATNSANSFIRRQIPPFPSKSKSKFSWLKYCVGKTTELGLASEDSSDGMAPAVDDTSVTSSVYVAGGSGSIKRRKEAPNNNVFANLELNKSPDTYDGVVDNATPQSPINTPLSIGQQKNGGISPRFRTRASDKEANESKDCSSPLLRTYKVLIEYKGEDGKRPSVRLSSCGDSNAAFAVTKITSSPDKQQKDQQPQVPLKKRHSAADAEKGFNGGVPTGARNSSSMNLKEAAENASRNEGLKKLPATVNTALVNQNGRSKALGSIAVGAASLKEDHLRKSEKERRKNERKQEGKAAKTLSAILIAFIVTWTPYNVIVCWEAFFPNSIPDVLFTISYCLCYVNSTINPLCYALCNARFRMTYMRILRCKNWKRLEPHKSTLYRHAYLRRA